MSNELLNRRGIPFNAVVANALERARVVAVLDGWAERTGFKPFRCEPESPRGRWVCWSPRPAHYGRFAGPTPDAARAAAAAAIEKGEV